MAAVVYDTQMLDYGADGDVQMQSSTTDGWFQNEEAMDYGASTPRYQEHEGSVEVEMEPYPENVEFEMTDEVNPFSSSVEVELVDVDVPDASHIHTPIEIPPLNDGAPLIQSHFPQQASTDFHTSYHQETV